MEPWKSLGQEHFGRDYIRLEVQGDSFNVPDDVYMVYGSMPVYICSQNCNVLHLQTLGLAINTLFFKSSYILSSLRSLTAASKYSLSNVYLSTGILSKNVLRGPLNYSCNVSVVLVLYYTPIKLGQTDICYE